MSIDYGILQHAFDRTKELHPFILWKEGEEFIQELLKKQEQEPNKHYIAHRIELVSELGLAAGNEMAQVMLADLYFINICEE